MVLLKEMYLKSFTQEKKTQIATALLKVLDLDNCKFVLVLKLISLNILCPYLVPKMPYLKKIDLGFKTTKATL